MFGRGNLNDGVEPASLSKVENLQLELAERVLTQGSPGSLRV